jgi:predicted nucleic acid-binding protein
MAGTAEILMLVKLNREITRDEASKLREAWDAKMHHVPPDDSAFAAACREMGLEFIIEPIQA